MTKIKKIGKATIVNDEYVIKESNNSDIYEYLKYLFDRLPNQQSGDIEAFLPWNEMVQQECHV